MTFPWARGCGRNVIDPHNLRELEFTRSADRLPAIDRILDSELVRLLKHSQESFDNLKVLQSQIVHSEKLASIGQLVGGAAHELNNPITAMLGYSDLLLSTQLGPEQHALAKGPRGDRSGLREFSVPG